MKGGDLLGEKNKIGEGVGDADILDELDLSSPVLDFSEVADDTLTATTILSPPPPSSLDISSVRAPPQTQTEQDGAKLYRYHNPGGNFFTGVDTTSEVGGARRRGFRMSGSICVCRMLFRGRLPG